MKNVLTVAGSDCCGGAGIQADLKTMCALGVYGMSVVTAVTVQNTQKVYEVQNIDPAIVAAQIDAVYEDIPVDAVKIGMVSQVGIIRSIRDRLVHHGAARIVVDPVMISKSGYRLLRPEAEEAMHDLLAIATLVTPNIPEAEILTGIKLDGAADMERAARLLQEMGAENVLIKGGHLEGGANDLLLKGDEVIWLPAPRIPTKNTHGTGCTLSSAIACGMARGAELEEAVRQAKQYITQCIQDALPIGRGVGPLGHMIRLYKAAGVRY